MPAPTRQLETVLFLDIVGSTTIADELGDEAWRSLLARFRRAVRAELKRQGGREVDTAGDSFFATFPQPLAAIEAADAIMASVHGLGLDVRVGIHTGEVELSDGHVSGMTVHIGARAMASAGSAEIVVTGTVRDMEVGSAVSFEDAGEHELKGVTGRWHLYRATGIGTHLVEPSLAPDEAKERRRASSEPPRGPKVVLWLAAAATVLVAGIAFAVFEARGGTTAAPPAMETILVRIDPGTYRLSQVDGPVEETLMLPANLGGTLLRFRQDAVERRDLATGRLESTFPVPSWLGVGIGVGGGAVWLCRAGPGEWPWRLSRFDPLSGRETGHAATLNCNTGPMTAGPGGIWFVDDDGSLVRLNPLPPYRIKVRDDIFRFPIQPFLVVPYERGVWLVDAESRQLMWYEPASGRHRTIHFRADEIALLEGPDAYTFGRVWIVDPVASEIVPLGRGVEDRRHRIEIVGSGYQWLEEPGTRLADATSLDGRLWIALGRSVVAVPEDGSGLPTTVPMPSGFDAHSFATDRARHVVWVAPFRLATG
jgi:hypothetical protein